jgi:Cu(I)/Ag(I) efflux system membrane fusion protein
MKKQTFVLSILVAGFIAVPAFAAQAGCCGGEDTSTMPGCSQMSGHESHGTQATTATTSKLPQPVAAVFDGYIQIQTALAGDSLEGITTSAQAIAKSVKEDKANTFSATIGQQAEAVAKVKDLAAAREAFKPLSESLIQFAAKDSTLSGLYRQVHCPMAKASWLQTGTTVSNPYMGKAMARCGQFVKASAAGTPEHADHSAHMH